MAIHDSTAPTTGGVSDARSHHTGADRYCHHCNEVALAFDPAAERPRCRTCGKLG
ncbi:hypothetical protein ACOZ4I_18625 (plasmid) [Haloarcula salina]|uniref:hypothetical protein n=1 Tax=Haloarcula salina TaxID=1429914 RepID=UPI003C703C74